MIQPRIHLFGRPNRQADSILARAPFALAQTEVLCANRIPLHLTGAAVALPEFDASSAAAAGGLRHSPAWKARLAYFTLMASVAEIEIDEFRQDLSLVLHPSLVCGVSHLLSYWVKVQPLAQLLNKAVEGGELLHGELWHPLRPPMVHRPPKVRSLPNRSR
jgi:hypothetical protein